MTAKYPNAIAMLKMLGSELNCEIEILEESIIIGNLVGIAFYMYRTSKSLINVLVCYTILVICALSVNNFLVIDYNIHIFSFYYGFSFGLSIDYFIVLVVGLILIKFIQNKMYIKKLNELVNTKKED